ncbi:MAG: hypothetical protein APF84_19460 [Gracilibacter sp. BRH_c7a]|nr:MAG: hypothetical protein APF84_19460 [Gracilibacter sp. BRH_c7a]
MKEYKIEAEHLVFQASCHSVEEAVRASGAAPEFFVKNICLIDNRGNLVVAIVRGKDSVSSSRIGKVLNSESPRAAFPEEILQKSGYPCGGVPSFGYESQFLIDPKVMEMEIVYTGGGSTYSLVKITPAELVKANNGTVVRIRR